MPYEVSARSCRRSLSCILSWDCFATLHRSILKWAYILSIWRWMILKWPDSVTTCRRLNLGFPRLFLPSRVIWYSEGISGLNATHYLAVIQGHFGQIYQNCATKVLGHFGHIVRKYLIDSSSCHFGHKLNRILRNHESNGGCNLTSGWTNHKCSEMIVSGHLEQTVAYCALWVCQICVYSTVRGLF